MYSEITANKRQTIILMVGFVLFTTALIWIFDKYLGGSTGVFYGGIIGALIYVIISYYSGSRMALAVNRAQAITKIEYHRRLTDAEAVYH
jgi:hypothetical protein